MFSLRSISFREFVEREILPKLRSRAEAEVRDAGVCMRTASIRRRRSSAVSVRFRGEEGWAGEALSEALADVGTLSGNISKKLFNYI